MHKNRAARLELILIDKRQDPDVILGPHRGGNDGVILVNQLLQIADAHGGASQIVDLGAILLRLLLLGLEPLLIGHELLLHKQVIFDSVELEQAQLALSERRDRGYPSSRIGALLLALLPADASGRGGRLEFLVLLVAVVLAVAGLAIEAAGSALTHCVCVVLN